MNTTMSSMMIQGQNDSTQNIRVTEYKLAYSQDGVSFKHLQNDGVDTVCNSTLRGGRFWSTRALCNSFFSSVTTEANLVMLCE